MKATSLISIFSLVTMLCGCGTFSGKIVSVEDSSFNLTEDAVRMTDLPNAFGSTPMVIGLRKGKYVAIGQDEKGIFYRGPSRCFVFLNSDLGKKYLETGILPTALEKYQSMGSPNNAEEGGVWIPKSAQKGKITYFSYQDFRVLTGDTDSKIPPSPSQPADIGKTNNEPIQVAQVDSSEEQKRALQIAQNSTGSASNVGANAAGSALGTAVGHGIGIAGLRSMQGDVIEIAPVADERILSAAASIAVK